MLACLPHERLQPEGIYRQEAAAAICPNRKFSNIIKIIYVYPKWN